MSTKCHKTGHYLLEQYAGMLAFRKVGRRKVYRGVCSRCNRSHDLNAREASAAAKENRTWSA